MKPAIQRMHAQYQEVLRPGIVPARRSTVAERSGNTAAPETLGTVRAAASTADDVEATFKGQREAEAAGGVRSQHPEHAERGFDTSVTPWDQQLGVALPTMYFKRLSRRAQQIFRIADTANRFPLPRRGIPLSTVLEVSKFLGREMGIVQAPNGRMALIVGNATDIPAGIRKRDEKWLLHTHPTQAVPEVGHFNKDFEWKDPNGHHYVEAVLDWAGRVTFIDHKDAFLANPGGILDASGRKVVGAR